MSHDDMPPQVVVGVDLGGTNVRAGVATMSGTMIAHVRHATPANDGPGPVVSAIANAVRDVLRQTGTSLTQLKGIGIGAPGPSDMGTGVVFAPPNLAGWINVPLGQMLRQELAVPVLVGNDANLAALGELRYGAGRGVDDLVYLTVSTGIGGGIIIDGRLLTGVSGTAGEVGHMTIDLHGPRCKCGNWGCLEVIAAGPAVAREGAAAAEANPTGALARAAGGVPAHVTTSMVVAAAQAGDAEARAIFQRAARAIGVGCVNLIHIFNPRRIIIGGGVSQAGDMLFEVVRQVIQDQAMVIPREACTVVPAELGDDAGLYGAIALVIDGVTTLPQTGKH